MASPACSLHVAAPTVALYVRVVFALLPWACHSGSRCTRQLPAAAQAKGLAAAAAEKDLEPQTHHATMYVPMRQHHNASATAGLAMHGLMLFPGRPVERLELPEIRAAS